MAAASHPVELLKFKASAASTVSTASTVSDGSAVLFFFMQSLSYFHHLPTIHANHLGRITCRFPINMLMTVEQILGLVFKDIIY
jgi:hypothetical protein